MFSSLDSATQRTGGRYENVGHRKGKARVEEYIRASGVVWNSLLVGYYMSNLLELIERFGEGEEEEEYWLRYPFEGERAGLPLIDAERDVGVGLFVGAALKDPDNFAGCRVLAADRYYYAREILETFSQVTRKKGIFRQATPQEFRDLAPEGSGLEYMETHLVIAEYGYFNREQEMNESMRLVQGKPSSLLEYFKRALGN